MEINLSMAPIQRHYAPSSELRLDGDQEEDVQEEKDHPKEDDNQEAEDDEQVDQADAKNVGGEAGR